MNKDEVREIVRDTVHETLTKLGADVEHPLELQQDFRWIRRSRERAASLWSTAALGVVSIVVAAAAGALWIGIKHCILN